MINRKYNYFYKITNNINGFFYYGVHSTDNLNDGYMGSGYRLKSAYKIYGIENFSKEILRFFNTREDALEYESCVVTENLVSDASCYNMTIGGGYAPIGVICVVDSNGNKHLVPLDDPRYLSGELVSVNRGKVTVKDKYGNVFHVDSDDPRYLSGELVGQTFGKVTVKDKYGNVFQVDSDDPRYLSGELVGLFKNRKHTEEAKRNIGEKNRIHQKGSNNSNYGKCWIKNDTFRLNKTIPIDKLDEYVLMGWSKGRNMSYKKSKDNTSMAESVDAVVSGATGK